MREIQHLRPAVWDQGSSPSDVPVLVYGLACGGQPDSWSTRAAEYGGLLGILARRRYDVQALFGNLPSVLTWLLASLARDDFG